MNLKKFSRVNLERCTAPDGFGHSLTSWSEAEWTNAMAGEFGEVLEQICNLGAAIGKASNLAKKIIRHRDDVAGNVKIDDRDLPNLRQRIALEVADVVIYADLTMQRLGYDTSTVVAEVFNRKSDELQCSIRYDGGQDRGFVYLAGPYAHNDPAVRETRYRLLTATAAKMMREGTPVYSPITHNHLLATMNEMPTGWDFWRSMDEQMIEQCIELHVLMLDGWKESVGVTAEIGIAESLGKPVKFIEPE